MECFFGSPQNAVLQGFQTTIPRAPPAERRIADPFLRYRSVAVAPAWCYFRMPNICLSDERDRLMIRLLRQGTDEL